MPQGEFNFHFFLAEPTLVSAKSSVSMRTLKAIARKASDAGVGVR